ncbi:hypothetical protein F4781DRAFT_200467 [Annulohypoxylon bovei var. microspora]|nr:hypothetical protein F4781DRAFT_200467 [Annulohypoxylon bovei var. microspora]
MDNMEPMDIIQRESDTEFAIDLGDSSNTKFINSKRHHHRAPPIRSAPNTPYYFSNPPSPDFVVQSRSLPLDAQSLASWNTFPPPPVPRLDLDDVKRAFGKGLRDVEEFTDQHIQRSTALREVMEEAHGKAKEIEHEKESDKDSETIRKDRVLLAEVQRMYYAFASIEGCENYVSTRRRYSENLKAQSQKPPPMPSKAELLLGSDGPSPDTDLPRTSQLYFLGSPPKLYIIPFDKAVAAGLEDVDGSKPTPKSLPSTLQGEPPISQLCLPAAPFLFEPSPAPLNNGNIPDWFPLLKIPVNGDDLQSRWTNFLSFFGVLDKAIKLKYDLEKPKWDKKWHDPHPKWPHTHRALKGGWWKCRSGPDAPKAEAECRMCHKVTQLPNQPFNMEERHKEIMNAINEAMREVAEKDKAAVLAMLRQQDQQDKTSEYKLWVEEQQENKLKTPKKSVYHRTQGYNFLRGYEEPSP